MVKNLAGALVCAALVAVCGCKPSSPDQSGWRTSTEQAVTDMVSEVATSRLAVRQDLRGQFVGRYPVVVLTYSEEAAGKASESVTTLQPPPSARPSYERVSTLLSDATDAIARARIAVTAGDAARSRQAVVELSQVLRQLRSLEARLQAAP